MMDQPLAGQVAVVTGAGRGQGRNHCLHLAAAGASVIALDICAPIAGLSVAMASVEDLEETASLVRAGGGRCHPVAADVRRAADLEVAIRTGVEHFGRLDHVVANAGVCAVGAAASFDPDVAATIIDVNLTGVWNTCVATIPHLVAAGGGSMTLISSTAGLKGLPYFGPYAAAKHGVVGIMRTLALELGHHAIRVNTVHPTGVATELVRGLANLEALLEEHPPHRAHFDNVLPTPLVSLDEVSAVVTFLASPTARHITGLEMTIDAGASL